MRKMDKMIAPCGRDCSKCPAFIATQNNDKEALVKIAIEWSKKWKTEIKPEGVTCDGCIGEGQKASYCSICEIRSCCTKREKETCADCEEYICEKLEKFFKHTPEVKQNLEQLRKKK